jgi:uncharacterized protein (TIGR02246 family)
MIDNTPVHPSADTTTPEGLMRTFTACMGRGDLDGLVELYALDAVFEPEPGVVVVGRPAIRDALAELLALRPTMHATTAQVLQGGDVALVVNDWSMRATAPDGTPVERAGHSADVVRRQPDGRWLVVVDKP